MFKKMNNSSLRIKKVCQTNPKESNAHRSLAAIRALSSQESRSRLLRECYETHVYSGQVEQDKTDPGTRSQ